MIDQKSLLPSKVQLSGPDCFHLALDTHARFHNAGGNVVRMSFCLEGKLSASQVHQRLDALPIINWLCNIKLRRSTIFSVPYWHYLDQGRKITIREHFTSDSEKIPDEIFQRDIGLDASAFIEADLIHDDKKTTILFSWNHILMDGRGSGMLINHINQPEDKISLSAFFPKESSVKSLPEAIHDMFDVKRFMESGVKGGIASVASGREIHSGNFHYHILRFNKEETLQIEKNARENGTRFGINSFLIATCARSVNKLLQPKGRNKSLWIPVPYDGRLKGAFGPIISNNVSSVFYTIPQEALRDTKSTVASLSSQMTEQLKNEMPKKYNKLLNLLRHIPAKIYYKLVSKPGEGSLASFLFTATGEGIGDLKTFFELPVKDVVIYEPQTFPPGLTFLFLRFNNTLKVNISYSDAVISGPDLDELENSLRSIFLANES